MGTVSTTLPSDGQTIDASDVNTPINAILNEFNGNIDNDNIKSAANINGSKLAASSVSGSKFDATTQGGWIASALPAVSSVTNNGQRSYDITFASTVASLLTPGMRLRTTRTVAAPTQCTDLESSSSQFFSSASAGLNGVTFTDDFTCMAWVKLESYRDGVIIARLSGTNGWQFYTDTSGRVVIYGGSGGTSDNYTSYQSLPLGRWVHVAASLDMSGASGKIYIDGVEVPGVYANGAASTITQGGDLRVGNNDTTAYFDGKLAQVAVFSSVLSASTIRSYMSQGLSGSESTLVSAFSCNNSLLDLNTTNNNDLSANGGALMTNSDSPFSEDANGTPGGTYDYAIVTKVSTTTATVQVPEGCTIPTSGGVSTVDLSPHKSPFGMPVDEGRWRISSFLRTTTASTSNATYGSYMSGGWSLTVPVGAYEVGWRGVMTNSNTTTVTFNISSTALTGLSLQDGYNASPFAQACKASAAANTTFLAYTTANQQLSSQQTYVMYSLGASTAAAIDAAAIGVAEIFAKPALL